MNYNHNFKYFVILDVVIEVINTSFLNFMLLFLIDYENYHELIDIFLKK